MDNLKKTKKQLVAALSEAENQIKLYALERDSILEITTALRATKSRAELIPTLLEMTCKIFSADGATLVTRDSETNNNFVEYAYGIWQEAIGQHFPSDKGIAASVFQTGKVIVENDIEKAPDPRHNNLELMKKANSIASFPLISSQKVIAVLGIGREHRFSKQEIRIIASIANIAADAIYMATLHEGTVRSPNRLMALREIDAALISGKYIGPFIEILLDKAVNHLRIDAANIYLFDETKQKLGYSQSLGMRGVNRLDFEPEPGKSFSNEIIKLGRIKIIPNINESNVQTGFKKFAAAEGFVYFVGAPLIIKGKVKGLLEVFNRKSITPNQEWIDFFETLADKAAIAIQDYETVDALRKTKLEIENAYRETLKGWVDALDLRDHETEGHTRRVIDTAIQLASLFEFKSNQLVDIARGALLHDIGKIGVPDKILLKKGKLTDKEWVEMKKHPIYAFEFLKNIRYLNSALDIPHYHHERWDGTGYPKGLKENEIPLTARIFAIVDVWDALRSDRPYRKAWPKKKAMDYITSESGKHFDPEITNIFINSAISR